MQKRIDEIKTDQQIFDASQKIGDWVCDCGIDDEGNTIEQANGGSEHLISWMENIILSSLRLVKQESIKELSMRLFPVN